MIYGFTLILVIIICLCGTSFNIRYQQGNFKESKQYGIDHWCLKSVGKYIESIPDGYMWLGNYEIDYEENFNRFSEQDLMDLV